MIWGRPTEQKSRWHRWWAWHPVDLGDGRHAWLCWVERFADYGCYGIHWSYRLPGDGPVEDHAGCSLAPGRKSLDNVPCT